ncbi:MAG: methylcobamide--CoM methyltransferase [Chloroflexi bacterium]|nr:methylcobamide--CoM methyltransferase [Chloroflexota bacterium]
MITTVVGNYPKIGPRTRAPSLRNAIAQYDVGKITLEELRRIEDAVTVEVMEEQARTGVELVTDGQVRWEDGLTYFARSVGGFSVNGLLRYFDTNTYFRQPVAEGKLAWQGPISLRDFQFARQHSQRPVKPVITGPYTLARLSRNQAYPDLRGMSLALAEILNQEARELEKAGAPLIQVDEPAILLHKEDFPLFREAMAVLTRGLKARMALYTWFKDIGGLYPDLLHLPFQVFGLDFVMGRANFDILKDFPGDKALGFGIADARNTRMESIEGLVEAIRRIARVVSPDRLYVNPNCGLEFLPRETAYAKLVRMVEGVKKAQEVVG